MASAAGGLRYLPAHSMPEAGEGGAWPSWVLTVELVIPFLLACWLLCELAFYLFSQYLHYKLDKLTPPERSTIDPEQYVEKVMDIVNSVRGVYPFETFLTRWCGSETIQELKKGNVAQFLAWALFSKRVEDLLPRDYVMLHRMVEMVDRRFELGLEEGLNPEARTLRMTLEPLHVIHRPLCVYVCTTVVPRVFGNTCLRLQGFARLELNDTVYWYRGCREWPATQLPLVFFHGVSPGQCMYAGLTTLLSERRTAVLVEIPHVAMGLDCFRAKTEDEVVSDVRHILRRHGIRHCLVGGHSYGSIWAGWIIRALREEVKQAVLLDPVCILLCLPNTPFNFLYRRPQDPPSHVAPAPSILTFHGIKKRIFDYALHYVVSTELTIANAMRRQFWWHKKILHAEDLHCPAVVGLASDDILLSAPAIHKYLTDNCDPRKLEVTWWQDFTHGELLASPSAQCALDRLVRAQEERHYNAGQQRLWEVWPHEQHARGEEELDGGGGHRSTPSSPSSVASSLPSSPARATWVSPSPPATTLASSIRQRKPRKRPLPAGPTGSGGLALPSGAGSNDGSPSLHHQYYPSSSSSSSSSSSPLASSSSSSQQQQQKRRLSSKAHGGDNDARGGDEGSPPPVPSEDLLDVQLAGSLTASSSQSGAAAAVPKGGTDAAAAAAAAAGEKGAIPEAEGPSAGGLVNTVWHAVWG